MYDTARRASSLQVQQDTEARPGISTLKRGNLKKLITAKASPASSEIIIEEEDNTDKDTIMETKDNLDKIKSEDSNETEPEEEPVRRRRPNMVISFDNFDGSSLPPPASSLVPSSGPTICRPPGIS